MVSEGLLSRANEDLVLVEDHGQLGAMAAAHKLDKELDHLQDVGVEVQVHLVALRVV